MHLTTLVSSLSVANVWDLPLWAWRDYVAYQDDYLKKQREGHSG